MNDWKFFKNLITIDDTSKDKYDEEISRLAQSLVILEGIKEVDESKIYVDQKGILLNELKDTKNNFFRYIEISDLVKRMSFYFIDIIYNKKILVNIPIKKYTEDELEKSQIAENFKFDLFKEIFYEIRDAFLFNNKYGLDSYLSTRIRHGTLLGQIRSQFENQFLITQKEKESEKYFANEYWDKVLDGINHFDLIDIQKILGDFSEKVDDLTNSIKNNLIQIKINKKNIDGLFDYTYPEKQMTYLYRVFFEEITDYDLFIDSVFKELWRQTNVNLEVVRNHLSTRVKDQYISYLNELEAQIRNLKIHSSRVQELYKNIINCKTNITDELDKIANWFHIRETTVKDFKIDKALDTSIEITNKISINSKIYPTRKVKSDTLIRGDYFIALFDLLRIFLENIVQKSELSTRELDVSIEVEEHEKILSICIINNLGSTVDIEELKKKFEQKRSDLDKANWDTEKIKKEEGTGFYKAKKILQEDLNNRRNSFFFYVDDFDRVHIEITINLKDIQK